MLTLKASRYGHIGYFEAFPSGDNFRRYLDIIKGIPSRSWSKKYVFWSMSIVDFDILIKDCDKANLGQVNIEEPLKRILFQYNKWRNELAILVAKESIVSDIGKDFLKLPMMPHQEVAVEFLIKRKVAINGDEMGVGKTLSGIVVSEYLKRVGKAKNCLIVCPASVKWNWAKEFDKFVENPSYEVIEGDVNKRIEKYMSPATTKIINFELLRNDYETILYDTIFDCIIVDEIHRIRNYKSKQTKALIGIGKKASYRIGLTGTPIQNKLTDLYSIMKFIHPHLLGNWYAFDKRYNVQGYFGEIIGHENLDEIHKKLKNIMIRRFKKDVIKDLPPKIKTDIYVELPPEQRKLYDRVKNDLLRPNVEDDEEVSGQANILTNITYLREICDSCELIEPESQVSCKLAELKPLITEILENGHKVVIFSQWKRMIYIINRELKIPTILYTGDIKVAGGERTKLEKEFKESTTKNVLLMTTAGGEGINLQCADHIIFFDVPFNPKVIAQIEDRLHRKGQKNVTNVIRLLTKNTIEDDVLAILDFKIKLFNEVIEGKVPKSRMVECQLTQKEILKTIKW